MDLIFADQGKTISFFASIKDFSQKSLSENNIFSIILQYLFIFRANISEGINTFERSYNDLVLDISIRILYCIHARYKSYKELYTNPKEEENDNSIKKENNKIFISKKRKKSDKNKQSCERRKRILKPIKAKMDKLGIKAETIEKGIFRHFLDCLDENQKKRNNNDFTKIINKYKDFCEELKTQKQYNSDLMVSLFEKPEFCELYAEYKKKYKNNGKEIYVKTKKEYNADCLEIYEFYAQKFELIFNLNLNLEENLPNSSSNNIQNNNNSNNHLLNNMIVKNEDIKTKKSDCINLDEKKDLNENDRNSFGYQESFDENSFGGHYFNFPSFNHSFGNNDENNNENLLKSENSTFNLNDFFIKK